MPRKKRIQKRQKKCNVVYRVPVHSSITIGGASIGSCQNDAAPGLICCWEHATRETLIHYVKQLLKEREALTTKLTKVVS